MVTICAASLLFCLSASVAQRGEPQKISEVRLTLENKVEEFHGVAKYATIHPRLDRIIYIKETEESGTTEVFQRFLSDDKDSVVIKGVGLVWNFSLSRDGTKIALSSGGMTWWYESAIYIANIDGSGLRKLTQSKFLGGSYIDPDTGEEFSRPPYDRYYSLPLISPNGKKVLFIMADSVKQKDLLCVINSDGSALKILDEANIGIPKVWSNDSRRVYYFEIDEQASPPRPLYLVEYDLERGSERRITEVPRRSGPPLLLLMSPGEEKVYYYSDTGLTEYYLLTQQRRMITQTRLENLVFSPSAEKLVGSLDNRLYVIRISDGQTTALQMAAEKDPLELSKLKPLPKQMDILSPQVQGQMRIQSLQWIDEKRLLCVIANDKLQKIGILTLSP